MNRKGFAISTLIYGLSIMGILLMTILIAIMSVNRSNNRKLSTSIEEDLTRFSRTEAIYSISGDNANGQKFEVVEDGWYRIELQGASGGTTKDGDGNWVVNGGRGAYTSGVIELKVGDTLYFHIGKATTTYGEASDVRILSGNDANAYNTRIMVAAGGGKDPGSDGGTLLGYTAGMKSDGGRVDIAGTNKDYQLTSSNLVGYQSYNDSGALRPTNSIPSLTISGDGGRGYYSSSDSKSGGTSYIAGYAGCTGITKDGNFSNDPGVIYADPTESPETGALIYPEGRMYYFVDGMMFPGVNQGNGTAKIERVVSKEKSDQELVRKNSSLNNVTSITDCVGSGQNATKIIAVAKGKVVASSNGGTGNCVSVSFPATNLDEIAVWHKAGQDTANHSIEVNGSYVKKATAKSETETPTGYRISAYQYNATGPLPSSGNYYLLPVLSENKVVTAVKTRQKESEAVTVEPMQGLKTQKWSIELLTNLKISSGYNKNDPSTYEYKITELARFRALAIKASENKEKNFISATEPFNNKRRNDPQIWKIEPIGDGTYQIKTVVINDVTTTSVGNILPQLDPEVDHNNEVIMGKINPRTARFRLIAVDYSGAN